MIWKSKKLCPASNEKHMRAYFRLLHSGTSDGTWDPARIRQNSPNSDNAPSIDQELIVGGEKQGGNRKTSRPADMVNVIMEWITWKWQWEREMEGEERERRKKSLAHECTRICFSVGINNSCIKYFTKHSFFCTKIEKSRYMYTEFLWFFIKLYAYVNSGSLFAGQSKSALSLISCEINLNIISKLYEWNREVHKL